MWADAVKNSDTVFFYLNDISLHFLGFPVFACSLSCLLIWGIKYGVLNMSLIWGNTLSGMLA